MYLDDGIVATGGYEEAVCQSRRIQEDLAGVSFMVNESKSQWVLAEKIVWLGFELDLAQGQLRVLRVSCKHCVNNW